MTQVGYSALHLNHFLQKYSFNTTSLLLLPFFPKLSQKTTTLILSYFAAAHGNLNRCNETQKDWSLSAMQNPDISLKQQEWSILNQRLTLQSQNQLLLLEFCTNYW